MTNKGASFRHRRVSSEMRALRIARNLTCADVGRAIGCSESKVSRLETGKRGLHVDEVAAILGFLQAPPTLRQELLALVQAGEDRNWHVISSGKLPTNWKEFMTFEAEASALYNFEPVLVPGLAQTPDYARAAIHSANSRFTPTEVDALVATRMGRQVNLGRKNVHLIMDETALRRPLGDPAMMRAQLNHLLALATRASVILQVVPFDAPGHPGISGPMTRMEFPDQPDLLYEEGRTSGMFMEDKIHIEGAKIAWQALLDVAWSTDESMWQIARIAGSPT
ncbi:helix-turn-helix transcriptional regulator [Actinosynnema sp. NPDC020468]|uniref:helix-turn-helix domain-containing protein n=1 Tax=Actinosynnema sp. NPDC020468 TaxID=3154488 RepID=UPI00341020CB